MQVEVTGLTFALSSMMGARQVLGCYAGFAALGTWARWVLQPLRAQSQAQAEAEAALRSGAVRVCAHAEEIESLGGKAMEGGDLRCVAAAMQAQLIFRPLLPLLRCCWVSTTQAAGVPMERLLSRAALAHLVSTVGIAVTTSTCSLVRDKVDLDCTPPLPLPHLC